MVALQAPVRLHEAAGRRGGERSSAAAAISMRIIQTPSSSIAIGLTVGSSLRPRQLWESRDDRQRTAFSEFDVVDVRSGSFLKQRQDFTLGAVETAHAGVILRSDDHVERLEAQLRRFDGALRRGSADEVVQPSCR